MRFVLLFCVFWFVFYRVLLNKFFEGEGATIASGSYYLLLFAVGARVFFFFFSCVWYFFFIHVLVVPIFIFIRILFGFIHVFQVQTAVREPRKRITFKLVKAAGVWVVQGGAGWFRVVLGSAQSTITEKGLSRGAIPQLTTKGHINGPNVQKSCKNIPQNTGQICRAQELN